MKRMAGISQALSCIGITLDSEGPGGYAAMPWYALRRNYCEAVTRAGGLPLPLPPLPERVPELAAAYLDRIDGLIVTGGAFDIDPALFGAATRHATVRLKEDRTQFELALVTGALARDLPVLGICGGQQLLNVVLGGTLIQHIPDEVPGCLAHEQPTPRTQPGHEVMAVPGSLLHRIVGQLTMAVNSAHHQAVQTVGSGVVVSACAPDGVIEAIEVQTSRFCLGVQWHPEYAVTPADDRLFMALVQAGHGC